MVLRDAAGLHQQTARGDVELLLDAYSAEFAEFVAAVREGRAPVRDRASTPAGRSPWRWPASSRCRRGAPYASTR